MARSTEQLMQDRARLMGPNVATFYEEPVHMVRGEGVWLWDADGNEVTPRITKLTQREMEREQDRDTAHGAREAEHLVVVEEQKNTKGAVFESLSGLTKSVGELGRKSERRSPARRRVPARLITHVLRYPSDANCPSAGAKIINPPNRPVKV